MKITRNKNLIKLSFGGRQKAQNIPGAIRNSRSLSAYVREAYKRFPFAYKYQIVFKLGYANTKGGERAGYKAISEILSPNEFIPPKELKENIAGMVESIIDKDFEQGKKIKSEMSEVQEKLIDYENKDKPGFNRIAEIVIRIMEAPETRRVKDIDYD